MLKHGALLHTHDVYSVCIKVGDPPIKKKGGGGGARGHEIPLDLPQYFNPGNWRVLFPTSTNVSE